VSLRVVGGDEEGSLKSEAVNIFTRPKGLEPEKDYAGEYQQHMRTKDRSVLSLERASHRNKRVTVKA
jgi:hypothetical protein